jgi:hypothetical protein
MLSVHCLSISDTAKLERKIITEEIRYEIVKDALVLGSKQQIVNYFLNLNRGKPKVNCLNIISS